MKKNACFLVAVFMLMLGVGGVGFTAATYTPAGIAASTDGMVLEKNRKILEAELSTGDGGTRLHLIDGGRQEDRVKGGDQAGSSPDAEALSRADACSISRYVSTAGSDSTGAGSNDCLDASSPCRTIQHAIDTAGGTEACPEVIHVAAGTYDEHLLMNAWESLDGGWNSDFSQQWDFENDGLEPTAAYATVIDGANNGTCITQHSIAGANINGLTLQNGRGLGGGIYLDHSHPAIANCTVKENICGTDSDVIRSAGGLYNYFSNPTVDNCAFRSNACWASENSKWEFDDIPACAVLNESSQAVFTNSSFSQIGFGNMPVPSGLGMVNIDSSLTITNCRFEENAAGMCARCPLLNFGSTVTVKDCLFFDNEIGEGGPSAVANVGSTVTIVNTRFLNNETIQSASDYAATVGNSHSTCTIINSIFAGNISYCSEWGQIISNHDSECTIVNSTFAENNFYNYEHSTVIRNRENSRCMIKNSIIWASRWSGYLLTVTAIDTDSSSTIETGYSDIDQDGFEGSNGNIRQDPKFVKTGWQDNGTPDQWGDDIWVGGDYHLQQDSPCIDSGTQDGVTLEDTDFEGDPRVMDGDIDFVAQVDMGADEFDPAKGVCFVVTLMD